MFDMRTPENFGEFENAGKLEISGALIAGLAKSALARSALAKAAAFLAVLAISLGVVPFGTGSLGAGFWVSAPLMAQQADPKAQNPQPDPKAQNPQPDPLDILMPLPCGLSMAFRVVAVPAQNYLSDFGLSLGGGGDYSESLVSRPHMAFVASSLTVGEIPEPYRQAASQAMGGHNAAQLYLFGKYEVTAAQWTAVMEGCGAGVQSGSLPKTSVSWFEAVRFTEAWMRWLLQNQPASLPRFSNDAKEVGLVRLPTESEWEYAARGGQAASPEALGSDVPALPQGESIGDYGVVGGALSPIGSRKPNALGIFDTAGNASEMTMDTFRMTIANRLHGAHGGVTVKGGSHLDDASGVRPGRRIEMPFFDSSGAARATNLGFRLVVSAINVPGGRMPALQTEFKSIGDASAAAIPEDDWGPEAAEARARVLAEAQAHAQAVEPTHANDNTPSGRIRSLIETVPEPTHKAALSGLLEDVEKASLARDQRTFAEVQDKFLSILYAAWGIRDTSLRRALQLRRLQHFQNLEAEIPLQMKKKITAQEKTELAGQLDAAKASQAPILAEIPQYDSSLAQQYGYYKTLLFDLNDYDKAMVMMALDAAAKSIQGDDPLTISMNMSLASVAQDVKFVLAGQNNRLSMETLMVKIQQPGRK